MPDGKRDVTHYTRYFGIDAPKAQYLTILLVVIGALTGIAAELLIHYTSIDDSIYYIMAYGASAGIVVVALPAILMALLVKAMNLRLKLKHAFIAVLPITVLYAILLIMMAALFGLTNNYVVVYTVFLLGNVLVYGYWFMMNRIVLNQRRSQVLTAAVHPMLNMFLYLPASPFLLSLHLPVNVLLIKLWAGMAVFVLCGYSILYFMDRPSKRQFNFSGVELMSGLIHQWLYDASIRHDVLEGSGVKRDLNIDVLSIRGKSSTKAVFARPDMHYGPISGLGGAVATEQIGARISRAGMTPFILHGFVNIEDNPISSSQIPSVSYAIERRLKSMHAPSVSYGSISKAMSGPCSAIAMALDDTCILTLTKAPTITEDIDREIGEEFTRIATKYFRNVIGIDAHNSRFESAPAGELKGIQKGSKYIGMYGSAISSAASAAAAVRPKPLSFGCASTVPDPKTHGEDIGKGHMSVGVFGFGRKRFCMVYFDSNNMLPSFRASVIDHIKERFGIDSEVYTTDTHSVNTLGLPVSNVLGRKTKPSSILGQVDDLISKALENMEPARVSYSKVIVHNFKVWGRGSDEMMMKISREVIRTGKRLIPTLIAGFFVLAMLIIYVA